MLDPLIFTPSLRPRIWGGRRLATVLGKVLPDEQPYGESWELSPIEPYISRVAEGPLAGSSLDDVWQSHRRELVGQRKEVGWAVPTIGGHSPPYDAAATARSQGQHQFPLLIKWLDCTDRVSIQVHPNDAAAPALGHPLGKAEAWLVADAAPTATVGIGLRKEITRHGFERRLAAGTVEEALHTFHPRVGDAIAVPPGTVHTIGGGLLLLEVSQPSDATFRLFDWDRPGPDGRPRPLHHREALQSIDWTRGPVGPATPAPVAGLPSGVAGTRLVAMPQFEMTRYEVSGPCAAPARGELSACIVLSGTGELRASGGKWRRDFQRGETVLIPATAQVEWTPTGAPLVVVVVTVPESR